MPEFQSLRSAMLNLEPVPPDLAPEALEPAPGHCEEPAPATLDVLRSVRLFHATLRERIDAAVPLLLEDIAANVLARELRLAPAEIGRICERALARFASEKPLCVRMHPADAARHVLPIPVRPDVQLRAGDAILELRDGAFVDATLGVRLAAVLESFFS